ncbi:MAG TPA: hypothetical protein GXX64_11035 [Bacteroidales bacterium]|nr:hypothetical protein [Bacteroidales bacterium]
MKENLRKLQLIFKLTALDPEMFYSIGFMSQITLQGALSSTTIAALTKLKFNLSPNEMGFLTGSRNGIEVILT